MNRKIIFSTLFFFTFPITGYCGDYFIFTHTFNEQQQAQKTAVINGGWVLNTSFYSKLTPNLFAVVKGPFKTKINAQKNFHKENKDAYIKNAGEIELNKGLLAAKISPQILVALLSEMNVSITEVKQKSEYHPCEPQEPYFDINVNFYSIKKNWNEGTKTETFDDIEEKFVDFGGFWSIINSGEIDRLRICAE
jgi:hypothetical protein